MFCFRTQLLIVYYQLCEGTFPPPFAHNRDKGEKRGGGLVFRDKLTKLLGYTFPPYNERERDRAFI